MEGRGDHVTAVCAILNQSKATVRLTHRTHPSYDRSISPGLYRYPFGVTAPVKWSHAADQLMELEGLGTIWQDNAPDGRHVRFKRGGAPSGPQDGQIIYTRRRAALAGEQYLVLAITADGDVRTQASFTPGEAIWRNLKELMMKALDGLLPGDFSALLAAPEAARGFAGILQHAGNAPRHELEAFEGYVAAALKPGPERWAAAVQGLSEGDRAALKSGEMNQRTLDIAKALLTGLGIVIPLGVFIGVLIGLAIGAVFAFFAGPLGWAALVVAAKVGAAMITIAGGLSGILALIAWVIDTLGSVKAIDAAV